MGQGSFDNFRVVPPGTGLPPVNLEYLARRLDPQGEICAPRGKAATVEVAYPDTLVAPIRIRPW